MSTNDYSNHFYTNNPNSNNSNYYSTMKDYGVKDDFLSKYSTYPSYADEYAGGQSENNTTSSWLHGNDFLSTEYLNPESTSTNLPNLSSINFDQIKIGEQTMENVLQALDHEKNDTARRESDHLSRSLNGLNLDSSFTTKQYSNYDFNNSQHRNRRLNGYHYDLETGSTKPPTASSKYSSGIDGGSFSFNPMNRSSIIKSHQAKPSAAGPSVSFNPNLATNFGSSATATPFFTSPDVSLGNMTLPAVDATFLLDDGAQPNASRKAAASVPAFSSRKPTAPQLLDREREQFVSFAVQQYRMLASMNPEMLRRPENLEELAERETFKYWAKLFIEERERQARIVLNLQKALVEALSSSASKGPNALLHLGAATGDFDNEDIGRYADQCRRKSAIISKYFKSKTGRF